jgi:hypothetical protein
LWSNNNPSTRLLRDNVICATGNIRLSTSAARGRVTLVAGGEVLIDGSDANLSPAPGNTVLLYSSSSSQDAIDLDGSSGRYTGFLHAPNGRVDIHGSDVRVNGSIVSDRVHLDGSSMRIDSSWAGQNPTEETIWLVE